jgi:two-component system, OmpR family, phosphate regulon sensor histidine kinase PhoR
MKNIFWLISAAALGILALIAFQVIWMRHSRALLEEQFNNKVSMALCSAVETVAENPSCKAEMRACCAAPESSDLAESTSAIMEKPAMQAALKDALAFHQINLPYEPYVGPRTDSSPFSCSLQPILANDSLQIQLAFKGKNEYFLNRMGLMLASSVGILLFIFLLFVAASYYLLRQKRMSDKNRDFFNQMTHEFRTPLANIRLAGTMLEKKNPDLAGGQYLDIIRNECGHLTHQVENVLFLAGLEKGDYQLHKEPVSLKKIAGEVITSMDLQIRERSALVRLDEKSPDFTIKGDVFHLRNAFRNLIDNALKYSGEKPEISIDFQTDTTGGHVRFTDNGRGLSPAEQKKAFQKFHRCDNAFASGEKGFGIGLSYVKKIVEMHRGQVSVSSRTGAGACFDLYFPA